MYLVNVVSKIISLLLVLGDSVVFLRLLRFFSSKTNISKFQFDQKNSGSMSHFVDPTEIPI